MSATFQRLNVVRPALGTAGNASQPWPPERSIGAGDLPVQRLGAL